MRKNFSKITSGLTFKKFYLGYLKILLNRGYFKMMILRGNNTKFHKMRDYRVVSLGKSVYWEVT